MPAIRALGGIPPHFKAEPERVGSSESLKHVCATEPTDDRTTKAEIYT